MLETLTVAAHNFEGRHPEYRVEVRWKRGEGTVRLTLFLEGGPYSEKHFASFRTAAEWLDAQ